MLKGLNVKKDNLVIVREGKEGLEFLGALKGSVNWWVSDPAEAEFFNKREAEMMVRGMAMGNPNMRQLPAIAEVTDLQTMVDVMSAHIMDLENLIVRMK